jgi:hypothetical protein
MVVSTYGPLGSEEEDDPDSGRDFSGLRDPSAMRDFMTACDYCLSGYSDDGHSLDDEGCGPSRECFHVDLGDRNEGNHLGMPEDNDPPVPASRIDIPRELAVVPVPAGGQDTQLEQIREMQAKLDEEAGQLVQLRQNVEQEWAGRALAGDASLGPGRPTLYRWRCQGKAAPRLQRGWPESSCSSSATPSNAGAVHHRGPAYPGRTQESPGGCLGPTV